MRPALIGGETIYLNAGDYIDLRTSHSEASGRSLWNQSDRNYVVIKRVGGVG